MFDMNRSAEHAATAAPLVAPLQRFARADLQTAGGKAANLGELIRAGFPVPPGFVVTTAAYDRFVAANGLQETIARALRGEPGGASIRQAFERAPVPPEVERDLLAAYDELGRGPVAVRSSATAEDLPEAAFAGQQDTFLNVVGPEALPDAVRRCWASLWSDRAIAYRQRQQRQGLDDRAVKLAVVVQRMVAAEAAGVLFTANPVTGARDETVVDASPGLGEAVVSGRVTPDHFVLRKRKRGWAVSERRTGRREVIVKALPEGGTEQIEGGAAGQSPPLPDRALRRLARLGSAIERRFGHPQDVEWTWAGGTLAVVQARPITALPDPAPRARGPERMLAGMFAEMFPVRPYPLDQTTWIEAVSAAAVVPLFSLLGIAVPPVERLFTEEDGVVIRFNGRVPFRPTPAVLLAPARLLGLSIRYNPRRWQADPLRTGALARARVLEARDPQVPGWQGLLATVREALALALPLAGTIRRRYYPRVLLAAGVLRLSLGLLGQGKRFGLLLSGAESTTLAANQALEKLAVRVRSEPALAGLFARYEAGGLAAALAGQAAGRSFLTGLQAFLDRYGHREVVLSTVLQPTWKDAPDVVLGLLKGLALSEARPRAGRPAWQTAQEALLAYPLLRFPPLRAATLRLLGTARLLWQIREDTHFDVTRILPILRRTLLELGRRLAGTGALDTPEDVFHLRLGELERAGAAWPPSPRLTAELRSVVRRRKERRTALEGKPLVDPRLYRPPEPAGGTLLQGMAGSPGIAEGPVRVVRDASQFESLRAGEVLVAPYTNPAWTPLFQRAVAVVVDSGAAGSHPAIVAREYGLPAVVGTVSGTQVLRDGEWVRVDGDRGSVRRVRREEKRG